jgi:hypothetical protein
VNQKFIQDFNPLLRFEFGEVFSTTRVCTLGLACHVGQPEFDLADFSAPFFSQFKNLVR